MLFSAFLWFQFGSTRWAKLLMDFWWDGWRLRRCVRLRCRTNVTALAGFSATTRMISATAGPFYKLRRKFFVSFLCDWWCCVDGLMLCRRFEVCVGWTYGDDADDFVTLSKTNTEYVMQDTTEVEQHGVPWMEQHGVPWCNSTEYHVGAFCKENFRSFLFLVTGDVVSTDWCWVDGVMLRWCWGFRGVGPARYYRGASARAA